MTDTVSRNNTIDVAFRLTLSKEKDIVSTLILKRDKQVLVTVAALTTRPENNDSLVDGTMGYRVVELMAI